MSATLRFLIKKSNVIATLEQERFHTLLRETRAETKTTRAISSFLVVVVCGILAGLISTAVDIADSAFVSSLTMGVIVVCTAFPALDITSGVIQFRVFRRKVSNA